MIILSSSLTPISFFFFLSHELLLLLLLLFYFTILYWFCHTSTCICHGYTHIPILNPRPTSLPIPSLWVIPVHQPQASCILHRTWSHFFKRVWCVCVLAAQSCLTLCYTMDCSLPDSTVHGILQARILEWVAIPFSRESFQPRDQTCIRGRFFYSLSHQVSPISLSLLIIRDFWTRKHFRDH